MAEGYRGSLLSDENVLRSTVATDAQLCQCAGCHGVVLFKSVGCVPCTRYLSKAVNNEGKMKTFPDKQQLREFISGRSTTQKIVKGVLPAEMKGRE